MHVLISEQRSNSDSQTTSKRITIYPKLFIYINGYFRGCIIIFKTSKHNSILNWECDIALQLIIRTTFDWHFNTCFVIEHQSSEARFELPAILLISNYITRHVVATMSIFWTRSMRNNDVYCKWYKWQWIQFEWYIIYTVSCTASCKRYIKYNMCMLCVRVTWKTTERCVP